MACIEHQGSRWKTGYGRTSVKGKWTAAHRLAYIEANGPIPEGMCVLHRCDNPPCVNPDHLWLGTFADNNRDRSEKGRGADVRGEKNPQAKVTWAVVLEMREKWAAGISPKELAAEYGLSRCNVSKIVNRSIWR